MRETVAVVLAGGNGSRFGGSSPKQLVSLAGQPILAHTLRKFCSPDLDISQIVVAGNPEWEPEIVEVCEQTIRNKVYKFVRGGGDRNASVRAAVEILSDVVEAKILVHDGVRPLVSPELISNVAQAMRGPGCVLPVIPSVDPIVEVVSNEVVGFVDRSAFYRGQSPQGFWLSDLRAAFAEEKKTFGGSGPFTTVYELVRFFNPSIRIRTVVGDLNNLKITMPVDHLVAGRLLLEE
ncbi:2-C-methyl-D-erythritol 4-phosphate cytidylyltransferase [Arthrobacter sp. ZGTC212]|uniref:IspD/TarI family cytidylyltransferase n=1 Tax=Arthrobacter sp. ZGTC212 TaxID=2058899 RepID=UPI0015E2239D|nr:IspD/TarI family cytidylyltransferase [Arthrobacter sp. ZGTC212]